MDKPPKDKKSNSPWYEIVLKKHGPNPDDPFDDFLFIRGFSLPLARYAYKEIDTYQKEQKKKKE
jgi:hypothetical protein